MTQQERPASRSRHHTIQRSDRNRRTGLRPPLRAGRLEAAVHEAWELRRSPYFVDAVAAVLDVWDRRQLIEHELRETPLFTDCEFGTLAKLPVADLVDLIRETP